MIEEYIKLLESFKQNQISKLIERIDTKIFEILYSKHVNPRIAPYFPHYELCLLSDETVLEPGTVYVREQNGKIAYSVITPNGETVKDVILEELDAPTPFSQENIEQFKAGILSVTARKGHTKWAPFTDYSLEPDTISQIKKLINALYYARLTFLDLEHVNVRQHYNDLHLLYNRTIDSAYEASFLLTHLDVDLTDLFHEELAILLPLLGRIQNFAEKHAEDQKAIVNALQPLPLAYKTGEVAGVTIDQTRPIGGDVDYNFLTQFSAVLPSYIDKLTHYIQEFSSQIEEKEPALNKEKLDELRDTALRLLNDIEHLKGNSIFISLKFLKYIHIIRDIITLSMSTLEQIGELSESSQDLIRDKLAQLKYTILPTLFGLVDKLEDNTILKPGTLSVPLMTKVKALYNALLYLPKKVVDFKTKGEELLDIEDSRFIELRLDMSYKRIDKANKKLYKIKKAQEACEPFFAILNNPLYQNICLYQLPVEVKQELIKHYKLLKPYMTKLDIDLNDLIIDKLTGPETESWSSYLSKPWRWVTKALPSDHISFVLAKQKVLNDLMTKDENSQLFHINLNKDLIHSVHRKANLVLFPYSEKTNIYALDESMPLQIESDTDKKFKLSKTEFQDIQNAYVRFAQIIKKHMATKPKLYENNLHLHALDEEAKTECHQLYKIFQPYLSTVTSTELKDSVKSFDRYLADLFAKKPNQDPPSTDLFLKLDKNIQDSLTYIHFKLLDKAELQTILNAYTRFSELIKNQINTKPQLYENNLLLNNLDEQTKNECHDLYKIFQPYFKFAISPELKNSAENFENYLAALLTNKPLDILEAPSTALFMKLDKNILDFFKLWQDKSQAYYNLRHNKLLSEQESNALRMKRERDAKVRFKISEENKLLENPDQLSADQALELCQWYRNKHHKFLVAQNAYMQFLALLKSKPQILNNILLLNDLDPKIKDKCRNLYNIFQPYFIDAAPPEMKEDVLKFDKSLVAVLSNRKISKKNAPSVNMLLNLEEHIQDFFAHINSEWNRKSQFFHDLTQEKFILENDASALEHDPNISSRAHYVIQHTNYSRCIHEFREAVFEVTKLFNKPMQVELTPQTSGIPFPEMEDNNKRLDQSRQVCAFKDLFNSMYHLEGIALELEKLNNKSAKSLYVYYLLQAYGHINEIIKLSKRLAADPHLGFMARELLDKAQILYATFQEHSDAYQVNPAEVLYGPDKVRYNPLWYVLNAFYISPKHIRALKNNNYLTTEELNELHVHAKQATLIIEGLIKSSDSYFKLFLQTPNMIYLYQELTKKLNEFTSTAHDTALDNLDKIRSTVFTPMLLEADHWEDQLGLMPGCLSEPLRKITDEFYKGLLHPLDLHSKTHIALVCNKTSLEKRINLTQKHISDTNNHLAKIENKYKNIEDLFQCMQKYKKLTGGIVAANDLVLNSCKEKLCETYKKALPKLAKLKLDKKVEIAPSQYPEDHKLDELCNLGLKDYDPHFTEIEALINASHHYCLGLKATHQMQLQIGKEKLAYLTQLISVQEEEHLSFVEHYTTQSFEKHLTTLCNRHIGLQYTDKEYRAQLKEYLFNFKDDIIIQSKTAEDINLNIKNLLKEKISSFEKKHYANYYHLDTVRVALAQFKNYFSYSTVAIQNKDSLFENEATLNEKTQRINVLDAIAENSKLSAQERVEQIKKQVKDPNFSRIILAHKQLDTFSFSYLKFCFLSLLEALHLYIPARKKLLNHIHEAVNNPPEISELTTRFGLFAKITKAVGDKPKKYEIPTMPIASVHV